MAPFNVDKYRNTFNANVFLKPTVMTMSCMHARTLKPSLPLMLIVLKVLSRMYCFIPCPNLGDLTFILIPRLSDTHNDLERRGHSILHILSLFNYNISLPPPR